MNTLFCNKTGHKIESENYLRSSGLNYVIVRPCRLMGDKDDSLDYVAPIEQVYVS